MSRSSLCTCDVTETDTFRGVTHELATNTCMHGLPNVSRAQFILRKIFWTLLVMSSVGVMVWQIQILVTKYLSYPVTTLISLRYDTSVAFPMITICNLNPVRRSMIQEVDSTLQDILHYDGGAWKDDLTDAAMLELEANLTMENWEEALTANADYFETRSDNHYQLERIKQSLARMSKLERSYIGHDIYQMLLSCTYNGRHCSPLNFTHFLNPYYGNCYVFNSGTVTPVKSSSKTGPANGLVLDLFIEHDEYIGETAEAAGIKVVVTNQTDMPFPEDEGYLVSPGTLTNIAITRTDINRASYPYGTCMDYDGVLLAERNLFLSNYSGLDVKYTDKACYKTCYQKAIIDKCVCCSADYPCEGDAVKFPSDMDVDTKSNICDIEVAEQDDCRKELDRELEAGKSSAKCDKECLPPCSEILFSSEITSTLWPSDPRVSVLSLELMKRSPQLKNQMSNSTGPDRLIDAIRNNVLKLQVFYQKLNYQVINTTSSYSESDLISDVGGQLGVWAGISLITLFEFGEYFVDLLILCILKMCGRKRVNENLISPHKNVFQNRRISQVAPMESLNLAK